MEQEASHQPQIRFEAELAGGDERAADRINDLGLDRIPGPDRTFRVLITAEDAERMLERGVQVRLLKAHKVQPLARELVMTDEAAEADLEQRTRGIAKQEGK